MYFVVAVAWRLAVRVHVAVAVDVVGARARGSRDLPEDLPHSKVAAVERRAAMGDSLLAESEPRDQV